METTNYQSVTIHSRKLSEAIVEVAEEIGARAEFDELATFSLDGAYEDSFSELLGYLEANEIPYDHYMHESEGGLSCTTCFRPAAIEKKTIIRNDNDGTYVVDIREIQSLLSHKDSQLRQAIRELLGKVGAKIEELETCS